jgi:hypothetical protein
LKTQYFGFVLHLFISGGSRRRAPVLGSFRKTVYRRE